MILDEISYNLNNKFPNFTKIISKLMKPKSYKYLIETQINFESGWQNIRDTRSLKTMGCHQIILER